MTSSVVFPALGTTASVAVTEPARLPAARAVVDAEIAACDQACSRFRGDSDLSRLNAGRGLPVTVSPRLLDDLRAALRAARLTDGAVDPTVGQALIGLGYDRDFALVATGSTSGSTSPVFTFAPVPGWQSVRLDASRGRASVPPGVQVDLGATAKARCADLAAAAAAAAAGCGVLVNLGGDVAVAGPAPAGGWRVRVVDDCGAGPDALGQTVEIESGGLATSGVTVRTWRRGNVDLHHVIDPRTGAPAAVVWRTVSVAAATCTDANIAATAAIVLGRRAPEWLEARRLPARLVAPDGATRRVGGWPREQTPPAAEVVA